MGTGTRNGHKLAAATAIACLLALSLSARGQEGSADKSDQPAPDASAWRCAQCPFPYGWSGELGFGFGNVSDEFSEFGNFGGLEDDGPFIGLDGDATYRDENARYLRVTGDRLGLDSRSVSVEGGRQGSYGLSLEYSEIPYLHGEDTRTVFLGAGTADQTLPADWVTSDGTQGMTALAGSLRNVDLETERKTLRMSLDVRKPDPWRYHVDVERTRKEGSLIQGGSFIFRSAQLAAPVDYETTNVQASVGYYRDRWDIEAAYDLSVFDDGNRSLRWDNPFTPINGADQGRIALSPDSQSHQVMLSGSWRMPRWLAVAGQVAFGRMTQDEPFLPYTVNDSLAVPVLPRDNLDGEVNTRLANLRVTSNLTDRLSAGLQLRYDERDDNTPRDDYLQVVTDVFVTDFQTNKPFSYKRRNAEASLDYRVFSSLKLMATAEHEETDRTFVETANTRTDTYTLGARSNPLAALNLHLEFSHERRATDLDPGLLGDRVNPGLRRFYLADRNRDAVRFDADYALFENWVAGVFFEAADEDYTDTGIGLSNDTDRSYGVDLSAMLSEHVNAHGFVALESIDADISGADLFDPVDLSGEPWSGKETDNFRTVGLGLEFNELPGKWTRGALEFTYSNTRGRINVSKEDPAPAFPELKTARYTLQASAARELRDNWDLDLRYLVARRSRDDFYYDGVGPDTISNLLALDNALRDRTVHVISVMLRYHF